MRLDGGDDEVIGMIVINNAEKESIMVVSENGYGKRSQVEDYRKTSRATKGVKTMQITEKTGRLVAIKNVSDEHDLMIINKSGITIRLSVAECRIMGRATQGVKLINLTKKNDVIASVCKVMGAELEANVEQMSRTEWAQKSDSIKRDMESDDNGKDDEILQENDLFNDPDFSEEELNEPDVLEETEEQIETEQPEEVDEVEKPEEPEEQSKQKPTTGTQMLFSFDDEDNK